MKKKILFVIVFVTSFLTSSSVFASSINITQINFTSSSQSINVNTVSSVITIQTQNLTKGSEQTDETNYLDLSSNSSTGEFSSSNSTWKPVNKLTMSMHSANRNFYYRDSTPGIYTLTVSVEGQNWTPATQSITIVNNSIPADTISPIISLIGDSTVNLNVGDSYVDAGATALDNGATDLTTSIIKGGTYIDTSTAGTYTITYDVSDNAGNHASQVTRTIIINNVSQQNPPADPTPTQTPTENIIIRNGNTIIYSGSTPLPATGTIDISDDTGVSHAVNTDSILGVIYSLSQTAGSAFTFSDLQYYSGMGFMVKCITPKDQTELCSNWQYVVGGIAPWDSIDTKVLSGGETVGIYFGYPYQVTFDKTLINTGESFNATAQKYNSTLGTWEILSGVNVNATVPNPNDSWNPTVVTSQTVDSNGSVTLTLQNAGTYNVSISDSLGNFYYIPTYTITVNTTMSGGGGTPPQKLFSVSKALEFLLNNPASSPMYMDWVAVAAGAGDNSSLKSSLFNYLKSNPVNSSVSTDNERRAMALMSLGINPYSGTEVNYIKKITDSFDGTQFGDTSLLNDDIFALIPLANAGYTSSDTMISKDIAYIVEKENSNGSWDGSIDLTAAAVQALSPFSSASGVSGALSRASSYLQNAQDNDGGWGNVSSSSWVAQVLGATWSKNGGKTAADYFAGQQETDGAVLPLTETLPNRIWATAYAVPAMTSKPWREIMQTFEKPVETVSESNSSTQVPSLVVEPTPAVTTTIPQNQELVKKVEVKAPIVKNNIQNTKKPDLFKKTLKFTATDPKPLLSSSTNNNLGANAGDALSTNISISGISQTIKHSVISFLTFIGKGFMDLISFIQNRI